MNEKVELLKAYPLKEAIELITGMPKLKFNESIDISVNLGVDPKKSDQNVRGSSSLPHGIGKVSKVAVFAEGDDAKAAKKAGADIIGYEDLIEDIKKKKDLDADIVIASPDCMKLLGQLGRILGPKNLMPNPKEGTVTKNIKEAVERFNPETLLVGESCTAELIQDQPGSLAKGMGLDLSLIHI